MAGLKNNRLLWVTFAFAAAFWIIAPLVPNPYLSSLISFCLLSSAIMTFYQYSAPAYRILWRQERYSEDGRGQGSHLAVLGIFLFALGSASMGLYGLTWNFNGQPPDWIGSAPSQFGRACHVAAFCLMQISPQITTEGLRIKFSWWVVAILATSILLIGFYFGLQVKIIETTDHWRVVRVQLMADRPSCPPQRDVWVGSSQVYHTSESPYRGMVIPKLCFRSEEEARLNGFRPPNIETAEVKDPG